MSQRAVPISLSVIDMAILQQLRENDGLTRKALAERLGLSRSKITQHVDDLMTRNIITDATTGESSGGRRPKLVQINASFCYVVGMDMGTTGATIGVANFRGGLLQTHRQEFTLQDHTPMSLLQLLRDSIFGLLEEQHIALQAVYAVGVGVPAPLDKQTGLIINPANMPDWENFSIADHFVQDFPSAVVQVDNDANMMALGEAKYGVGSESENLIFTKVGTGVGCGIVHEGQIHRGADGTAGDIGHVSVDRDGPVCYCGNIGCLEKLAAAPAMVDQALQAVQQGESTLLAAMAQQRGGTLRLADIGTAASQGDKVANEIIVRSGQTIGRVLATLVSFFNPSSLVIGGQVSDLGPQFVTSIHRTILDYSQPISTRNLDVQKSRLGHLAGVYGTVSLALDAIFQLDEDSRAAIRC